MQQDPMKRVRDARKKLRKVGIEVLGHQENDPKRAVQLGLPVPKKGEIISVDVNNRISDSSSTPKQKLLF